MNAKTRSPGPMLRARRATMHWGESAYLTLYRALGGRWVDKWTGGMRVILLTTTGRTTGRLRTVALGHLPIEEGLLVAGTNGGRAPVPGWVWNLRADPLCRVEAGRETFAATATFLHEREYESYWRRLTTQYPIYQVARDMLERPVPLMVLSPIEE